MSVHLAHILLSVAATAAATMSTIFVVILHLFYGWERSPLGRALMAVSAALAAALDVTLINALVGHHYPGEYAIAIALYLSITVATGNLLRLVVKRQDGIRPTPEQEGATHDPDHR